MPSVSRCGLDHSLNSENIIIDMYHIYIYTYYSHHIYIYIHIILLLYIYTYILYKYINTVILHHIASEFYIYIICSMFVPSNLDVLCTYLEDLLEVFLPICTNHPPTKSPESLAISLCSLYIIPVYQYIGVS